ncbi:MAG: hypothetical protein ABSE45_10520 [Candidatus Acidiferrales bacterium]
MNEQKETTRELEGLLIDDGEQAIDSMLRRVLEPYVGFTRDGKMITKPAFLRLGDSARLLVALLGRQAAVRLALPGATAEANAEALHAECQVPRKSCAEYLSRYKQKRLLEKNKTGYFVPIWAMANVAAAVQPKNSE